MDSVARTGKLETVYNPTHLTDWFWWHLQSSLAQSCLWCIPVRQNGEIPPRGVNCTDFNRRFWLDNRLTRSSRGQTQQAGWRQVTAQVIDRKFKGMMRAGLTAYCAKSFEGREYTVTGALT